MIWGFPSMGVSKNGWFISWKILLKWMMTGGTPISGTSICQAFISHKPLQSAAVFANMFCQVGLIKELFVVIRIEKPLLVAVFV
jgi:hypothetical protein